MHVDEADIALAPPFEAFWSLFGAVSLARNPTVLDLHSAELTDYARDAYERAPALRGPTMREPWVRSIASRRSSRTSSNATIWSSRLRWPSHRSLTGSPERDRWPGGAAFAGSFPHTYPINMIGHPLPAFPVAFRRKGAHRACTSSGVGR